MMNINPVTVGNLFKVGSVSPTSQAACAGSAQGEQPSSSSKIHDTITISQAGSNQRLFSGLSKRIASEIVSQDSPARIQELKEAIHAGAYRVSSTDLADAMLCGSMID